MTCGNLPIGVEDDATPQRNKKRSARSKAKKRGGKAKRRAQSVGTLAYAGRLTLRARDDDCLRGWSGLW